MCNEAQYDDFNMMISNYDIDGTLTQRSLEISFWNHTRKYSKLTCLASPANTEPAQLHFETQAPILSCKQSPEHREIRQTLRGEYYGKIIQLQIDENNQQPKRQI